MGFNTGAGDSYGIPMTQVNNLNVKGNWVHYTLIMHQAISYTNNKIYVNGVSQTLSQLGGVENPSNRNFSNGQCRISSWRQSFDFQTDMKLSVFRIYFKELSQAEIDHNHTIFKEQFNL
jgi:hypothetical protein